MKRFICTALSVSVLFLGLGAVIDRVGAAFRSDERAIAIVSRARTVIGSDNVRSLTIVAKSAKTVDLPDGQKVLDGDLDIALELPNRLSKTLRLGGAPNGGSTDAMKVRTEVRMVKVDGDEPPANADGAQKIVIRKSGSTEGATTGDGNVMIFRTGDKTAPQNGERRMVFTATDAASGPAAHGDELLRLTLTLLGRTPEGADVALTYLGEGSVDGSVCDNVAAGEGESAIKVCFDRATGLPRSASFMAPKPLVIKIDKNSPEVKDGNGIVTTKLPKPELGEYVVKFSDYRTVDGVQLPFSWTQTQAGKSDETVTVTNYAINPADIAEKFKNEKVVIVKKSDK